MHILCVGYGNRQAFLVCYGPVPKHLLCNNGLTYVTEAAEDWTRTSTVPSVSDYGDPSSAPSP